MRTIKFFHPEETFTYDIEKCFCKVVYSGKQHQLLIEIHSTEDLDHVEDDSLQNDYPQVVLTIDDFPVNVATKEELNGKILEIPTSFVEIEDEDGELEEFYYTSANFSDLTFDADANQLTFSKDTSGNLCLVWKGEVQDFTEQSDQFIPFEVNCTFTPQKIEVKD